LNSYIYQSTIANTCFTRDELNLTEFEDCTFIDCNFGACNFLGVTFLSCSFRDCQFEGAQINHVALRSVKFVNCNLKNLNFAMCDRLLFEVTFDHCRLDFSKFYTLPLHGAQFSFCSLLAVDFMKADIQAVVFDSCDLHRTEFEGALAQKANFYSSENYSINPAKTNVTKAIFSAEKLGGLVVHHQLKITS
jgi:uncharacterized protein YjbI with pentapeptide repeats